MKNKDERRMTLPHGPALMEAWGKTEAPIKVESPLKVKASPKIVPKAKGG